MFKFNKHPSNEELTTKFGQYAPAPVDESYVQTNAAVENADVQRGAAHEQWSVEIAQHDLGQSALGPNIEVISPAGDDQPQPVSVGAPR